jgi:hypothetical protein
LYHNCGHTTSEILHSDKCKRESVSFTEPKTPISSFDETVGAVPRKTKVCKETTSDLHYYISLCSPCTKYKVRHPEEPEFLSDYKTRGSREVRRKMIASQNQKRMEKMASHIARHCSPEKNEEGGGLLVPINPSTLKASDCCSSCRGRLNNNQPMKLHCGHVFHLRCIKTNPFVLSKTETICLVCLFTWDEMGIVKNELWFKKDEVAGGDMRFSYPLSDLDRRVLGSMPKIVPEPPEVLMASLERKTDDPPSAYIAARMMVRMTEDGEDREIVVDAGASRDLVDKEWISKHPSISVDRSRSTAIRGLRGDEMTLHGLATFNMYVPGVIDSKEVLAEVQVKAWLVENFKPLLLFGNSFLYPNRAVIDFCNLTITLGSCENMVAPIRIRTTIEEFSEGVSKYDTLAYKESWKPSFLSQ